MPDRDPVRSPVLSLTVLDGATLDGGRVAPSSEVLAVVRSAAANPTHPNVVSVPTQRLPPPLHAAILAGARPAGDDPVRDATYFEAGTVDSRRDNGHHPLVYAVESLLARKLGLADALESGRAGFRAGLRARVVGAALYDNLGERDVYEPIEMLNVVVVVDGARERLLGGTDSYSLIAWSSVAQFLAGLESKDPAVISPAFDPIDLCVHGVCLSASAAALSWLLGRPALDQDGAEPEVLHRLPQALTSPPPQRASRR